VTQNTFTTKIHGVVNLAMYYAKIVAMHRTPSVAVALKVKELYYSTKPHANVLMAIICILIFVKNAMFRALLVKEAPNINAKIVI